MKQESILVSVCMITYKHEKYIQEAILSILSQKTQFDFELIISDDCSPDGTSLVVSDLINSLADSGKIRYIKHKTNKGIANNFQWVMEEARGDFIAICEGDDYWTDTSKLQTQVDFLEANPAISGSAHNSLIKYEFTDESTKPYSIASTREVITRELLDKRPFHTASFLFRSKIIREQKLPEAILSADRALFLLVSSFGNIHYQDKVMCCYRRNDGGISRKVTTELLKKDLNIGPWIKSINTNFPLSHFQSNVHQSILNNSMNLRPSELAKHLFQFSLLSFAYFPKNIRKLGAFYLKVLPNVLKKVKL